MTKKWCIYVLIDPRNEAVRYVGWTTRPLKRRLSSHLSEARAELDTSHKNNWLRFLLSLGLLPRIVNIETGTCTGHLEAEIKWIKWLKTRRYPLTNGTEGGDGSASLLITEETRRKMSLAKLGTRLSEGHKQKIKESMLRYAATPVGRASMQKTQRIGCVFAGQGLKRRWMEDLAFRERITALSSTNGKNRWKDVSAEDRSKYFSDIRARKALNG